MFDGAHPGKRNKFSSSPLASTSIRTRRGKQKNSSAGTPGPRRSHLLHPTPPRTTHALPNTAQSPAPRLPRRRGARPSRRPRLPKGGQRANTTRPRSSVRSRRAERAPRSPARPHPEHSCAELASRSAPTAPASRHGVPTRCARTGGAGETARVWAP